MKQSDYQPRIDRINKRLDRHASAKLRLTLDNNDGAITVNTATPEQIEKGCNQECLFGTSSEPRLDTYITAIENTLAIVNPLK